MMLIKRWNKTEAESCAMVTEFGDRKSDVHFSVVLYVNSENLPLPVSYVLFA